MSVTKIDTLVYGEMNVIYTTHWSCSTATAHNTAHEELDITKFVYSLVPVPCCLTKEDKIVVLKLHF